MQTSMNERVLYIVSWCQLRFQDKKSCLVQRRARGCGNMLPVLILPLVGEKTLKTDLWNCLRAILGQDLLLSQLVELHGPRTGPPWWYLSLDCRVTHGQVLSYQSFSGLGGPHGVFGQSTKSHRGMVDELSAERKDEHMSWIGINDAQTGKRHPDLWQWGSVRCKYTRLIFSLSRTKVSHIFFFFFFWPHRVTCGIIVPQPGPNPGSLQWNCLVLTTGSPGRPPN